MFCILNILFRHIGANFGRIMFWINDGQYYVSTELKVKASAPFVKIVNNTGILYILLPYAYAFINGINKGPFGGPTIEVLCKDPSGTYPNQKGAVDVDATNIKGHPWHPKATCAQLECVCLGDPRLKVCNQDGSACTERSKEVLRFECNTTTNFDTFQDVAGRSSIIPQVDAFLKKFDKPNPVPIQQL